MLSYIISVLSHLKWAWHFLIRLFFFSHRMHNLPVIDEELKVVRYKHRPGSNGVVEYCAVCLCKMEEGEEIRELRCDHLFHRICLDRWVGYRRDTCPLCRDSLTSHGAVVEYGTQVLVFRKFTSFSSSERDTWWLR